MKKRIAIAVLIIAVLALVLTGCSYDYSSGNITIKEFTASGMETTLNEFIKAHPNRTSYSDDEAAAAGYIKTKLDNIGLTTTEQKISYEYKYSASFLEAGFSDTFYSKNIVGTIKGKSSDGKKVIIGAYYDNLYSYDSYYEAYYKLNNLTYSGTSGGRGAEGALGATGVAASLELAKKLHGYNQTTGLPFDVEFVYFGAEQFGCQGSQKYAELLDTDNALLYINLSRIGGDNIYSYFDEVQTAYGELVMSHADALGYGEIVSEPSNMQTIIGASSTNDRLPYTNYSLLGASGVMFGGGVKVCNFTTGVFDSFVLTDSESVSYSNICETSGDTLVNLKDLCPQYSLQMAVVADIVFASVTDSGLTAALAEESYNYKWLTYPLAAALTVIGLIIIIAVVLVLLVRHYEKKYPFTIPKPKKVKMAVFGMDYENPADADIFIDTKPAGPFDAGDRFDPFDGSGEEAAEPQEDSADEKPGDE